MWLRFEFFHSIEKADGFVPFSSPAGNQPHEPGCKRLSIDFEGDQTGAAEDSKIFLDMVRSFWAEGEALRIPV